MGNPKRWILWRKYKAPVLIRHNDVFFEVDLPCVRVSLPKREKTAVATMALLRVPVPP
jgi:hypothetical protein